MSRTSPRDTSKRTVAGVRSRACPSWKGGVGAVASPRSGEVGLLAQRARRVGTHELGKELGKGSGGGPGGVSRLPTKWEVISPPRHAGRSACSRSGLAGWGVTAKQKTRKRGVGTGPEAGLACFVVQRTSGELTRKNA